MLFVVCGVAGNCGQEVTRRLAASDAAAAAEALRVRDLEAQVAAASLSSLPRLALSPLSLCSTLEAQVAAAKEHLIEVCPAPTPTRPPPPPDCPSPRLAATVCVYNFPL